MVNCKFKRIWKEAVIKFFKVLYRILPKGLRKITKKTSGQPVSGTIPKPETSRNTKLEKDNYFGIRFCLEGMKRNSQIRIMTVGQSRMHVRSVTIQTPYLGRAFINSLILKSNILKTTDRGMPFSSEIQATYSKTRPTHYR